MAETIYNIQFLLELEAFILGGGIPMRKELSLRSLVYLRQDFENGDVSKIMPSIFNCQFYNDTDLLVAAFNFANIFKE